MANKRINHPPHSEEQLLAGMTGEITIEVDAIPAHVQDSLADAVLSGYREYLRQPGTREALSARIAAKAARLEGDAYGKRE